MARRRTPPGGSTPVRNMVEMMGHYASSSLTSYIHIAKQFLTWLGGANRIPTRTEFLRYVAWRQKNGIKKSTLCKEVIVLRKLARTNGWPYEPEPNIAPRPERVASGNAIKSSEVENLIMAQHRYSNAERFYLALATTYVVRRSSLCLIKKRDYNDSTIVILSGNRGGVTEYEYPIPTVLKPIFMGHRARVHSVGGMSAIFRRITLKAEIRVSPGTSWDALRDCQFDVLWNACVASRIDPRTVSEYVGQVKDLEKAASPDSGNQQVGRTRRVDMTRVSACVHSIHPWLSVWGKALSNQVLPQIVPDEAIRDRTGGFDLLSRIVHPARRTSARAETWRGDGPAGSARRAGRGTVLGGPVSELRDGLASTVSHVGINRLTGTGHGSAHASASMRDLCPKTGRDHKWRFDRERKSVYFGAGYCYWPYRCMDCRTSRTFRLRAGEQPPERI